MVIAVASPFGVNILGCESRYLPQESALKLLSGVPSKVVGLRFSDVTGISAMPSAPR